MGARVHGRAGGATVTPLWIRWEARHAAHPAAPTSPGAGRGPTRRDLPPMKLGAEAGWPTDRIPGYRLPMRKLLPLLFLAACDTPGTFGSALFQSDEEDGTSRAEMIAQLEAEPAPPSAPERVLAKVPPLPSDTWIQVFDRSARIHHRILDDGRYMVQVGEGNAQEMPVISQEQPQQRALSEEARTRIVEALEEVHFSSRAEQLPDVELDAGEEVLLQLRPLAVTVRDLETARVHTVELRADARAPRSFGELEPLWRVLDAEVFGHWLEAAVAASAP